MDTKPAEYYRLALKNYHNVKQCANPMAPELFAKYYTVEGEEHNVLTLCRMMDTLAELFTIVIEPARVIMRDSVIDAILKIAYHNNNLLTQKGER